MRLARRQRVRWSRDFRIAYDNRPHYVGKFMVLWLGRETGGDPRLGVIASKRAFRRAVDRAGAKRLLRESFRTNRHRLSGSSDVILVAKRRILEVSFEDLKIDLLSLAARAGLLDNSGNREKE